jgi:hypothetical protein
MIPSFRQYAPTIIKIHNSTGDLTMVEAPEGFPFEWAYPGQAQAVREIRDHNSILLSSPTGSGKTAVYLTATVGNPSLIISPRKYLQQQCAKYRRDVVVFGRSAYPCTFEENAADAPCRGKKEKYETLDGRTVNTFMAFNERTGKDERREYPCKGCAYLNAVATAIAEIKGGGTVIANFANFFPYTKDAEVIVLDEGDLFAQSISSAHRLKYVGNFVGSTKETLEYEAKLAKQDYDILASIKPVTRDIAKKIDKAKNHYLSIKGLITNEDLCFQYKKQVNNREHIYIEVRPDKINTLLDRTFPKLMEDGTPRKIIIATATPSQFTAEKTVTYELFMRTAVFYTPVALMTAGNVNNHPEVMGEAAKFIQEVHHGFKKLFGDAGKKTLVHCVSIRYAEQLAEYIGKENCDVHRSGKLMEVIEGFRNSPAEYLLACAMEYGNNVDFANHQFILKYPWAPLDERLQAFQSEVGKTIFNDGYATDAMNRLVQSSGRVGRGIGGEGYSFVLDRQFGPLYGKYHNQIPASFKNAVKRGGTL